MGREAVRSDLNDLFHSPRGLLEVIPAGLAPPDAVQGLGVVVVQSEDPQAVLDGLVVAVELAEAEGPVVQQGDCHCKQTRLQECLLLGVMVLHTLYCLAELSNRLVKVFRSEVIVP